MQALAGFASRCCAGLAVRSLESAKVKAESEMPAPKRRKSAQKERNNPEVHVECLLNWWLVFSSVRACVLSLKPSSPLMSSAPTRAARATGSDVDLRAGCTRSQDSTRS